MVANFLQLKALQKNLPECNFLPNLFETMKQFVVALPTMFEYTCSCDSLFSHMKIIKISSLPEIVSAEISVLLVLD